MSNVARGQDFASAVGKFLESLELNVEREYLAQVGIGSKSTKHHRFDFGSPGVLVECKCYGWTQGWQQPQRENLHAQRGDDVLPQHSGHVPEDAVPSNDIEGGAAADTRR
jgi:hypothetical protein